jgi:hypothetical protein
MIGNNTMTTKNSSKFASAVAPTLTASKPAKTAVAAPATVGSMTQDDLVALIVRTIQATQALNVAPAPAPVAPATKSTRKAPAVVAVAAPNTKPATASKPADGSSKSAAYIARCGNVDPKVIKGHLATAYRAGQAAQAGRRNAEGTAAYKAGYNASLISNGLPAFYIV